MTRSFNVNGESLLKVRFGGHIDKRFSNVAGATTNYSELGLTSEAIQITPRLVHTDILVDDYGPSVPAEILWQLADAQIQFKLVHYDPQILDLCLSESMGGTLFFQGAPIFAGDMNPAGTPLGGYVPYLQSGYHFFSLNILSPQLNFPWRFPACHLTGPPVVIPLGTEKSMVTVNCRAIPYNVPTTTPSTTDQMQGSEDTPTDDEDEEDFAEVAPVLGETPNFFGEISSSGAILWDHLLDS